MIVFYTDRIIIIRNVAWKVYLISCNSYNYDDNHYRLTANDNKARFTCKGLDLRFHNQLDKCVDL